MSEELATIIAEEDGGAIAVREHGTLFGTDDPLAVIEKATAIANALAQVLEQKKLYTVMGRDKDGKERRHVKVEGWTLLGSMMGVFPETEWTKECKDSNGNLAYEARVIARTRDGSIVGAREAMCSKSEQNWKSRDDYAIKSMAQTRATSGALAQPLRFIVVLAGFEGTPDAEMPQERSERRVEATREKVPTTGAQIKKRLGELLGEDEAAVWLRQAEEYAKDKPLSPTGKERLAGVVVDLAETTLVLRPEDFPEDDVRDRIQAIFAARFDGSVFDGPDWALNGAEADAGTPSKAEVLSGA